MDGQTLLDGSSRTGGRRGQERRHVMQSSCEAVRRSGQHRVRRVRETGSVAPGQMGGHKPKKIAGEHRVWLLGRMKERDFTLRGLVAELAERGLKVDYRSVWEFVHAERVSFKKKPGGRRTRPSRRGAPARAVGKVSRPHRA